MSVPRSITVYHCVWVLGLVLADLIQAQISQQGALSTGWSRFGTSVAASGSTIVIGSPTENAAYVLVRNGNAWKQQARLRPPNGGGEFGFSVAISSDTVVVGAYADASDATGINGSQFNSNAIGSGAAYVFVRNGTDWTQQAYLKASNSRRPDINFSGGNFGISVAISGDTVVVGASGEDSNAVGVNGNQTNTAATDSGAAYVFVRNGTGWTQQAYIKASNTEAGDRFGNAVAISGSTLIVGAEGEDSLTRDQNNNAANGSGAAYVFVRSGTSWTQQAYLKASNVGAGDGFGQSLSISNDTIVVGAAGEDSMNGDQNNNGAPNSGAAYVFVRNGNTWIQQAYLKASRPDINDRFGNSLAISGDTIVIGAILEDSNLAGVRDAEDPNAGFAFDSGAAYVFRKIGGNWPQIAFVKASNPRPGDWFGASVAYSPDALIIGAPCDDADGRAFVFSPGSTSAVVEVSKTLLSFSNQAIEPQTIQVTSSQGQIMFQVTSTTESGGNWLTVTPSVGVTPGTLAVTVVPGLPFGTYVGWIDIASTQASIGPPRVKINYEVKEGESPSVPATVFLVHGISQNGGEGGDLSKLAASLRSVLDPKQFTIDGGFDFSYCANNSNCDPSCTIGGTVNQGATNASRVLGAYVNNHSAPNSRIVIAGFSMGGLVARDMIVNGFSDNAIAGLITIGTPHLGYPYNWFDDHSLDLDLLNWGRCSPLVQQMFGDFRNKPTSDDQVELNDADGHPFVTLSAFLQKLNSDWAVAVKERLPLKWYTAAGTSCADYVRDLSNRGCRDDTRNDGVVCQQSASFDINLPNAPNERWEDPEHKYSHTGENISLFCANIGSNLPYPLSDPGQDPDTQLVSKLTNWIREMSLPPDPKLPIADSCPAPFLDEFDRPNGSAGNGWVDAVGGAGKLVIRNGALTTPGPGNGNGGVNRMIRLSEPVTVTATFTQANGFGASLTRYAGHGILFGASGSISSGYGVSFSRADQNYANSSVDLVLNGSRLGSIASTFQFGTSITTSVTYSPDGSIAGVVRGGSTTSIFNFSFGPRDVQLPGSNLELELGLPDGRSPIVTNPTIDNISISYACSGGRK